jgi:hypothetical protein
MTPPSSKYPRAPRVWLALCATMVGCSGSANTGRERIPDALAEDVPWVRGRPPLRDSAGQVVVPDEPVFPDIATGKEDPGSSRADCRPLRGLEFSKVWFDTFEADDAFPDAVGVAAAYAAHDDDSEGAFRTPGEVNWYPGMLGRHGAPWGLPADEIDDGPSCDGEENRWALHFKGGRFNRFGAGIGHPLALLEPCPMPAGDGGPDDRLCPPRPAATDTEDAAGIPLKAKDGRPYAQAHVYWDVSGFDGLAFWARRGPEGQGSLTVVLDDKHTSDDLARENETYCRRQVPCTTFCRNRQPCSPVDPDDEATLHRCFDPDEGPIPLTLDEAFVDEVYPRCGQSACTFPVSYPDRDHEGQACRPYTFDVHLSGEYCFAEGEEPPDADERCGDGFARTVTLSTDWKFFKVPFHELRQQGFGKIAPRLDLTTVSNLTFVVPAGWADFYLDNITFYREP